MNDRLTTEVLAILQEGRDMTLASLLPDGAPHAVVVSYASKGLCIYFGCDPGSLKARNIARDPRVAMTITPPYSDWGQIRGLAILGRATRLEADSADVAIRSFMQKFDEIAQFVSQPSEIAMFEITTERVSLLDYRQGFGHVAYAQRASEGEAQLMWSADGKP